LPAYRHQITLASLPNLPGISEKMKKSLAISLTISLRNAQAKIDDSTDMKATTAARKVNMAGKNSLCAKPSGQCEYADNSNPCRRDIMMAGRVRRAGRPHNANRACHLY
jgi:hypothetical protein